MADCINHPMRRALHDCRRCGKFICDQCNADYGRFCSRECRQEFQDFQVRVPNTSAVRRKRFSLVGCLRTLIISAILLVIIYIALNQLFGTTDPGAMWKELKRMFRVAF